MLSVIGICTMCYNAFLYVPHSPYSCSCIHCSLLLSSILPELHPRGIVRSTGITALYVLSIGTV